MITHPHMLLSRRRRGKGENENKSVHWALSLQFRKKKKKIKPTIIAPALQARLSWSINLTGHHFCFIFSSSTLLVPRSRMLNVADDHRKSSPRVDQAHKEIHLENYHRPHGIIIPVRYMGVICCEIAEVVIPSVNFVLFYLIYSVSSSSIHRQAHLKDLICPSRSRDLSNARPVEIHL
jgi:hypothetical protein